MKRNLITFSWRTSKNSSKCLPFIYIYIQYNIFPPYVVFKLYFSQKKKLTGNLSAMLLNFHARRGFRKKTRSRPEVSKGRAAAIGIFPAVCTAVPKVFSACKRQRVQPRSQKVLPFRYRVKRDLRKFVPTGQVTGNIMLDLTFGTGSQPFKTLESS